MKMNRRKFLTFSAVAAAFGIAGKPTYDILADEIIGDTNKKRFAMVIDLKKFFKNPELMNKCIQACNHIHNIPEIPKESKEIKWIWKEKFENAFLEQENYHLPDKIRHHSVLLLCNHCDNPPCVNVCPTQATWKRKEDGIVMMDWHRCIGCRYCMAACPYGSRSFNWENPRPYVKKLNSDFPSRTKGVVEKCTFCDERIAEGKLPACVEACSNSEMMFGDLNNPKSEIREILSKNYSIRRKPELGTQPEIYYLV